MLDYCLLLLLLCLLLPADCGRRMHSDEEKLLADLFMEYNPSARPVMNSSSSVQVSIQFSLMHIKELDVRSQVLTTTGLLILMWRDERLQWAVSDYGGLQELILEAARLWRPEFAVINGAEKIYENFNNFRAILSSNGTIRWEPGGVFKTMCTIDITYYPFDDQICELMFGAWSYHTSKMNLTNTHSEINLDSYKINGEWEISTTGVQRKEFAYECCPRERFANVAFRVFMRRRHTFYIMNVILPSILTSVLLLSIFFCTPGQKVQIGVVVLLSFRIFLLNVADNIPKTSDHIPLLGIYLTCTMAITTLSMVLTVFILNLHHISDRPVPPWVRRLVLVYFAKVVGMCAQVAKDARREQMVAMTHTNHHARATARPPDATGSANCSGASAEYSFTNLKQSSVRMDPKGEVTTSLLDDPPQDCPNCARHGVSFRNGYSPSSREYTSCYGSTHTHNNAHAQNTDSELDAWEGTGNEDAMCKEYAKQWKRVAEVFDRLFFWLFLLAILISTLVLFHPLTDAYLKRVI